MINVIKLDNYWESNNYNSVGHKLLLSIHDVYQHNQLKCLLLYRYKIDIQSNIFRFGCNNPDRLIFDRFESDYIILYHVEIYKKNPSKIIELFNYCIEKDIDLYLCIRRTSYYSKDDNIFWEEIEKYLPENKSVYNLSNNSEIIKKEIERNIKIYLISQNQIRY